MATKRTLINIDLFIFEMCNKRHFNEQARFLSINKIIF